jgi:hypothetical protein
VDAIRAPSRRILAANLGRMDETDIWVNKLGKLGGRTATMPEVW